MAGKAKVVRYGSVIKVRPEKLKQYKYLHAHPWPQVNGMIKKCHIRNYSIYYHAGFLFSYFEYTGKDFKNDMAMMGLDETTRKWWKLTDPCQKPLPTRKKGEHWASMEEVYHLN